MQCAVALMCLGDITGYVGRHADRFAWVHFGA